MRLTYIFTSVSKSQNRECVCKSQNTKHICRLQNRHTYNWYLLSMCCLPWADIIYWQEITTQLGQKQLKQAFWVFCDLHTFFVWHTYISNIYFIDPYFHLVIWNIDSALLYHCFLCIKIFPFDEKNSCDMYLCSNLDFSVFLRSCGI